MEEKRAREDDGGDDYNDDELCMNMQKTDTVHVLAVATMLL